MITITKSVQPLPAQASFLLTLVAVSSSAALDARVFVYHAGAGDYSESNGVAGDMFAHIASLTNMEEFPPDAPVSSDANSKPYYRAAEVSLVCRSEVELQEVWAKLSEDLQELVDCAKAITAGAATASESITFS